MNYLDKVAIAVISNGMVTVGFRILNAYDYSIKDCKKSHVQSLLKDTHIINLTLENDKIVGSNGSIDRLPKILSINGKLMGKAPLVIIDQIGDKGYTVCDYKGVVKKLRTEDVIRYAKDQGIANGKIVTKDGKEFISSISGSYDVSIPKRHIERATTDANNDKNMIKELAEYVKTNGIQYDNFFECTKVANNPLLKIDSLSDIRVDKKLAIYNKNNKDEERQAADFADIRLTMKHDEYTVECRDFLRTREKYKQCEIQSLNYLKRDILDTSVVQYLDNDKVLFNITDESEQITFERYLIYKLMMYAGAMECYKVKPHLNCNSPRVVELLMYIEKLRGKDKVKETIPLLDEYTLTTPLIQVMYDNAEIFKKLLLIINYKEVEYKQFCDYTGNRYHNGMLPLMKKYSMSYLIHNETLDAIALIDIKNSNAKRISDEDKMIAEKKLCIDMTGYKMTDNLAFAFINDNCLEGSLRFVYNYDTNNLITWLSHHSTGIIGTLLDDYYETHYGK